MSEDRPIVVSQGMISVFEMVDRLANAPLPVLIRGETGTGKELVAAAFHARGPRRQGSMIRVNCGAIPSELIESTWFGHERGSFTGASAQRRGVFEAAHRGTVFLDEIGELPLSAQASLLRVLDTNCITRVGSTREIELDFRMIAATHCDLEQMVASGRFRLDLFHRLSVFELHVPALRDRPADILPLARAFVGQVSRRVGGAPCEISEEALERLQRYAWPGNVRELRNAIERAAVLAGGGAILSEHLPRKVQQLPPRATSSETWEDSTASFVEQEVTPAASRADSGIRGGFVRGERSGVGSEPVASVAPNAPARVAPDVDDYPEFWSRVHSWERLMLYGALVNCSWNKTQAADRLNLSNKTVRRKIARLGLSPKEGDAMRADTSRNASLDPLDAVTRVLREALAQIGRDPPAPVDYRRCIHRCEQLVIDDMLQRTGGNCAEVARILKIPERTLREKRRRNQIRA